MTITPNISLLAQSNLQIGRLNDLKTKLYDLQRQATTSKKHEDFAGFGTESLNLQRLRADIKLKETYLDNMNKVSTRMTLQNQAMNKVQEIASRLINGVQRLGSGAQTDMTALSQQAKQDLAFMQDLINTQIDGQYLFGGSDINNPPFADANTPNINFQSEITVWLAGGQTAAAMLTTTNAYTPANLGLSNGLATSGAVTARIDDGLDIDYTLKADNIGFNEILNSLTYVANLRYPTPPDVATAADFEVLMDSIARTAANGVTKLQDNSKQLASKFNLIKSVQEIMKSDKNLLTIQIDKIENADTTEAITSLQAIQTQLQASYQVTKITSELSLVNYIR